ETLSFASSAWSSSTSCCSSSDNRDARLHLLGVDLLERRAGIVPRDLALRRVRRRDAEIRGRTDLLRRGLNPLEQALEVRACGTGLAGLEVDQLAREAVADRTPEVLLDQAVRVVGERLALVERVRDADGQRVAEGGERAGLGQVGLRVADADLDRREREVRADAPPDLRVLLDRARVVEE